MSTQRSDLQILGLTDVEYKVFITVSFVESLSVSELATKAKVPRTSALPALNRLCERGLVRKVSQGKKTLWKKTNPEKLRRSIIELTAQLAIESELALLEQEVSVKTSAQSEFMIIKGAKNILKFQEKGIRENTGQRSYLIQGSRTGKVVEQLNLVSEFSRLNSLIKERGLVTELLISEKTLRGYEVYMETDLEWKHSMRERLFLLYVVGADVLADNAIDIIIYKNSVSIINWEEETLAVIKNQETVDVLYSWFNLLTTQAEKLNPQNFFK
ncbi:MAG: Sugar-specific transcriptional regulator TrmB [Candidatus Parcubacteria bacterium]|jgi:sugar-specific transcriptional regulator TrmB